MADCHIDSQVYAILSYVTLVLDSLSALLYTWIMQENTPQSEGIMNKQEHEAGAARLNKAIAAANEAKALQKEIAELWASDNEWDHMRAANLEKWGRAPKVTS